MDTKIRNYLGIALLVAARCTALSAFNFSYSYSRSVDPLTAPNIRVTGEGKAVAVPDIAQFSFSVIAEGNNIQQIQSDKAGSILAGVVARGANSISQLSFTIDDRVKVESEARVKAIAQAKIKAEA